MDKNKIVLCRENEFPFEFLDSFLKARIKTGHETGETFYDEEINMYVANLLTSITDSKKMGELSRYTAGSGVSLNEMVSEANEHDNAYRYRFFKTNGDYILLRLGVFDNPYIDTDKPSRYSKSVISHEKKEEEMKQKGRIMYSMAATTLVRINGGKSGPGLALINVFEQFYEDGLDKYVELLRNACENCNMEGYRKRAVEEIVSREICQDPEHQKRLYELYSDNLLRTYSEYRKDKDPKLKDRILEIERNMQTINPDFKFKMAE